MGVEVTSFDGEFSVEKQLQDLQTISSQEFDFVAVHPAASDALVDAANQIIAKGVPLIDMDTRLVQDPDEFAEFGHLTYLEPDNIYMGSTVANELFKAMGGEGEVIHTQGQLAHTGAQGRAEGFNQTLANYPNIKVVDETPGDWQARSGRHRSGRTCCSASRTSRADSSTPTTWPWPRGASSRRPACRIRSRSSASTV